MVTFLNTTLAYRDDLWGHVRSSADHLAHFPDHGAVGIVHAVRRAKVCNLRIHVHIQQHVVAFQILMDDAALVQKRNAKQNLSMEVIQ